MISIIVPVYNVGNYLRRCVDSILAQTYQNIEVLLVDDGSPDNSGAICDEYAEKDFRVRVFHKPNGGVSSARNLGLTEAKGDYIGFVDADDYIDKKMYEVLLGNLIKENADISICSYNQEDKNGVFHKHWKHDDYLTIAGDRQIEYLISNQYYTCSCWDRLFKRELLESVFFDESIRLYEDYLFLYQIVKKSHKTVFSSQAFYYYCNNSNSASNLAFSKKTMDIVYVCKSVMDDIYLNYPKLNECAKNEYMRINIFCCLLLASSTSEWIEERKVLQKNVRSGLPKYFFSYGSFGYKIFAFCIAINWRLFIAVNQIK